MTPREFLIVIAMLTIALVSVKSNPPADLKDAFCAGSVAASEVRNSNQPEADPDELLPVKSAPLISRKKLLASAYFDTLSIVTSTNGSSLFFGGPAASIEVFKQVLGKVHKGSAGTAHCDYI